MKRWGWLAVFLVVHATEAAASEDEARRVADHALAIVLAQLEARTDTAGFVLPGIPVTVPALDLWPGRSFGAVSARLGAPDMEPARFHEPGQSIWEEIQSLDRDRVEKRWQEAVLPLAQLAVRDGTPAGIALLQAGETNVVTSYLSLHLVALRFAREAGVSPADTVSAFRLALLYEAGAQAYLRAAFFAGHMLVRFNSPFWRFHGVNTQTLHDHVRDNGLFVVNGSGDAWQTFGDDILESHPHMNRFILEAGTISLREVFLVLEVASGNQAGVSRLTRVSQGDGELAKVAGGWMGSYRELMLGQHALLPEEDTANRFVGDVTFDDLKSRIQRWIGPNDAPETYYRSEVARLPVLLLLPVPVTATVAERDSTATFSSYQRPQLRDAGYHDPELTPDELRHLPWKSQFPLTPHWPKWNSGAASILYPAPPAFPPSFLGLRTDVGAAQLAGAGGTTMGFAAGLGYAWPAGLYDLFARVGYLSGLGDGFVTASFGPRVENPFSGHSLRWIDAFLLEVGYVHDLQGSWSESGASFGISAVTRAWTGFTPVVNMGPALQLGARLYVRQLPLVGFFAAVGFQ